MISEEIVEREKIRNWNKMTFFLSDFRVFCVFLNNFEMEIL